jgi:hypothetical protein
MGFFSDHCPDCGGTVRRDAAFCPTCGKPAPRANAVCPSCGEEVKAGGNFCGKCGAPLKPTAAQPALVDALNRWKPASDEFARRIEAHDLHGLLRRGLVVEPGTQALILQGGAPAAVVQAGTYDLNRPLGSVDATAPATAILVDAGETPLTLAYRGMKTREDVAVDAQVALIVRLADPAALVANLLHGRDRLGIDELGELLRVQTAGVVEARVKQSAVDELDGNLTLKTELEEDLRRHVAGSLGRNGLALVELRCVAFAAPDYEPIAQQRAETFLAGQAADDAERRAVLNQRIRDTLTRDRLARFTSDKDVEEFIRQTEHELGMKEVIRRDEMDELKRTFAEKRADAEIARRHLLEKLALEQKLELLRQQHTLDDTQLQHRLRQERETLQSRQEAEWTTFQHQLRQREAERAQALKDTQTHAEAVRIKMGLADDAIKLRGAKAAQEHEEASLRLQREQEVKDREAQRELDKIRTMSEVEQARLAADLKKTEALKDMSVDQILALMAGDSPHVVTAIAERARAQANVGAEVKALYEKLLAGKEAESDRLERFMGRTLESVERIAAGAEARERGQKDEIKDVYHQSMDRMADVAVARAGAGNPGGAGSAAADVLCPTCKRQVPAGSKFCDNCGHRFYE